MITWIAQETGNPSDAVCGLRASSALTLEEEMIAFVSMEDNCYRDMLMERLGMGGWGVVDGGGPGPA